MQVLLELAPQTARIANPHIRNYLPLHRFSKSNSPGMVKMILDAYKDAVNIADEYGMLPVHYAAQSASVEVLKLIAAENL